MPLGARRSLTSLTAVAPAATSPKTTTRILPQSLTSFTSSKPSLASAAKTTVVSSFTRPVRAVIAPAAAPPTRAAPIKTPPSEVEDFDSYFDNDDSFELALSQLETPALSTTTFASRSSARIAVATTPAPPARPTRPAAVAPAIAARWPRAKANKAPRPAFPIGSPASVSSRSTASPATARAFRDSPIRTGVPVKTTVTKAPTRTSTSLTAPPPVVVMTLSQGASSQQSLAEVKLMAQREMEALVQEGVACWSEEEDF